MQSVDKLLALSHACAPVIMELYAQVARLTDASLRAELLGMLKNASFYQHKLVIYAIDIAVLLPDDPLRPRYYPSPVYPKDDPANSQARAIQDNQDSATSPKT